MTDRARALAAHLASALRTPFRPGVRDCALFAADWIVAARGFDPAAGWRGQYANEEESDRLLDSQGGLAAVVARELSAAGLERTAEPVAGDVGLLRTFTDRGRRAVGAICTGPRWVVLARSGVIAAQARPLAAWRV